MAKKWIVKTQLSAEGLSAKASCIGNIAIAESPGVSAASTGTIKGCPSPIHDQ
jgi:hypothetical protein